MRESAVFASRHGSFLGPEREFSPPSPVRAREKWIDFIPPGGEAVMEKHRLLEGEETHICQVGGVKDLDRTIEHLTSLGLEPFKVRTPYPPSAKVRGKKVSYQVRIAMAQQGPVQVELIEYQKGTTIQKDFLDQRGEGIHHILFKVRSLDKALEK